MNKLVVVESPTKARTISRFLDKSFEIVATMGHIRDLPKTKFGVEIKKNGANYKFLPEYVVDSKKSTTVAGLAKSAARAREIYLATDPDREGEAIAYHIIAICSKVKIKKQKAKFTRIVFHELTKQALEEALKNPGKINEDLVDAQQARRVLDRIVGYSLSPVLWKKVRRGLSAGRVQSVAVRLIVEREREIEKFKAEDYFRFWAETKGFLAQLTKIEGKSIEIKKLHPLFDGKYTVVKTIFNQKSEIETIVKNLDPSLKVNKVEKKESLRRAPPPFTTSTLQQTAAKRFGWSAKQTMRLAQSLFEKGKITYHRTDSLSLSIQAIDQIRNLINSEYGNKYLPEKPIFYKTWSKVAQEAHEAIRPSSMQQVAGSKDPREQKLYQLIWQRAVASQMAPAKIAQTKIEMLSGKYLFTANGSQTIFDGFAKVYPVTFSENTLPEVKEGEIIPTNNFGATSHATEPPPRYNEATLIAALEKNGIGRPSTYAPIITTIEKRLYVEKKEGRFYPTLIGTATNDFLVANFENVVDLPFTAEMEESLDLIAKGEKKWQLVLSKFWGPFIKKKDSVEKNAKRVKVPVEKTGEKCPKCKKGDLVIRTGRFGKFIACSTFPDCDYKASYIQKAGFVCPKCGQEAIIKTTKKGRKFFSCIAWPKCDWSSWRKP